MPDWDTNYVCFSDLLPERHLDVWEEVESVLREEGVRYELVPGTRDIWARDYMPIQVTEDSFIQFTFNPDYLRRSPDLISGPVKLPWMREWNYSDIVLDGGNVVSDGKTVIMTDKVYAENRPIASLHETLSNLLRSTLLVVPRQVYEVTGHIDGVLCFLSESRLLVNDFDEVDPCYGKALESYLIRFDTQKIVHYIVTYILRFRFPSAEGCYSNYLRIGNVILFPQFGRSEDHKALSTLQSLLPECRIHLVDCRSLAKEGGVLHCIGMNYKRATFIN